MLDRRDSHPASRWSRHHDLSLLRVTRSLFRFLRRRRFLAIWMAGALAVSAVLLVAFMPGSPLSRLNALVFDTYQTLRPRTLGESPVVVVDIDEDSIARFGQWPWPRTF